MSSNGNQRTEPHGVSRRRVLASAGTAGLGSLAGCAGFPSEEETGPDQIQFSGPQGAAMTLPTRLIRDEEFAADRGLDLELKLQPPPAIQQAIFAGEVESGTFPVIAGARANDEGRAVRLLGPVCRSFNSIVVREDADVEGLDDLQDVTLGSMARSSAPWTHWAVLANAEGFDHEAYDYRFAPPPPLFGAIQQGDIEAMIGVEPFTSRLLETGDYEEIYVFNDRWEELTGRPMPLVEVATYQETLDAKPTAVASLMEALFDAGAHIAENTRDVIERYEEELGLETDSQKDLVEERIGTIYPGSFDEELRVSGEDVVARAEEFDLIDSNPGDEMFRDPREL